MSLQDELDALRAEFVRSAPPVRAALYDAKVDELRRTFPIEKALKTGDHAPDFTLPNPSGRAVSLSALLRSGPAVVTFYRGGWCPYCNLQLRAYQQALGEITALGAKLVAISPQLPDGSMSTAETNRLSFDVLSDVGNRVARSRRRSRAGPAPRYLTWFVPTSPDCEVKGAGNSQAATIRVSMRYVTTGCSPGRRRGQGFAGFHPPARDCQTRVPVAILALRLPTEVEEAA
jgi:hypothetical protein